MRCKIELMKILKALGLLCITVLVLIHLYGAYRCYFLAEAKLSRFFILQTNIKAPDSP